MFNPYAELLTFPSSKLKTRRDKDKFLRLINVICFLHQYQRKTKKLKPENGEPVDYIECTPDELEKRIEERKHVGGISLSFSTK